MTATAAELAAINREWRSSRGSALALATLIEVEGSSYRRPGARLLIDAGSRTVGNLTGGCLDQEIVEAAREVHRSGVAQVVEYDLRGAEEAVLGWGMGCNGLLRILVEPATADNSLLHLLDQTVRLRRPVRIATVVSGPQTGHRWWQVDGEEPAGTLPGSMPSHTEPDGHDVFTETLLPAPRVVICGAGDDVPPVVRAATGLGWEVVVVDHRRLLLAPERFPAGTTLVRTLPEVDAFSYVLVMTHNFLRDCEYLAAALATPAKYIGVLGPNRRLRRIQEYLASDGFIPSLADEARLRGPVGLDLGGQGPDEIAVEIIADLLAATRRPIHQSASVHPRRRSDLEASTPGGLVRSTWPTTP
ncbi:XdhC family protein [Kribbella swartbergensis]